MKKYFCIMLAAAAAAVACNKENLEDQTKPSDEVKYVEMTLTAEFEAQKNEVPETKTTLADGGEVKWLKNDIVSIFDNSSATVHKNRFTISEDLTHFTGTVPDGSTEFFALYPNISESKIDLNARTITTVLNPVQKAAKGTFASNTAIMFGKVDANNNIEFKNLCSHIRFTLASDMTDVKSITLLGNNDEILAGSFTVNLDGETITTASVPAQTETYVTLRNTDGSALEAGDYYFTTLPVEFKNGFTVILSKTDGSQVAKKTASAFSQIKDRNGILVMKELASTDYAEHMNYFVRYNDGFDLTFGGVTFNNTTKPGGVLVSDNKTGSFDLANSDTGVYFISPNCTKANLNSPIAYKSLIIVGTDSSKRSDMDFSKQARPYDGGDLILLENLRCTVGNKNAFAQNKGNTGHAFTTFGDFVLDNCHFKNIGKQFLQFTAAAFSQINIKITNSEFGFNVTEGTNIYPFVINTGSNESTITSLSIENNIFYQEDGATNTDFRVLSGDKLVIKDLSVCKNTFTELTIKNQSLFRVGYVEANLDFQNNMIVDCPFGAAKTNIFSFRNPQDDKTLLKGTITNTFYYTTETKVLNMGLSAKTDYTSMTINSIAKLDNSPLSTEWNPAKEEYGAYNEVTYNGSSKVLPKDAGAKRADMTATPSTSATANSADYRNGKVDLGTF